MNLPRTAREKSHSGIYHIMLRGITKCGSSAEFQTLPQEKRFKYVKKMKARGLSVQQISRLTGLTYNSIQKA